MIKIREYESPKYTPELQEVIDKLIEVVQKEITESELSCFEAVYLLRWITGEINVALDDFFIDELLKTGILLGERKNDVEKQVNAAKSVEKKE